MWEWTVEICSFVSKKSRAYIYERQVFILLFIPIVHWLELGVIWKHLEWFMMKNLPQELV